MKYMQSPPSPHRGVEFQTDCSNCGQSAKTPHCLYCRRVCFMCAICHVSVLGKSLRYFYCIVLNNEIIRIRYILF